MSMRCSLVRWLSAFVALCVLFLASFSVSATVIDGASGYIDGVEYPIVIESNSGISTYAYSVEGINVTSSYIDGSSEVYFQGDTYCNLPNTNSGRVIQTYLTLPESIGRGEVFDLNITITHSSSTLSFVSLSCYDSSWNHGYYATGATVSNDSSTSSRILLKDISSDFATKYIRLNMKLSNISTSGNFTYYPSVLSINTVSDNGLLQNIIELITSLPDMISDAIAYLFDMVVSALDDLGQFISDCLDDLGILIQDALSALGEFIIDGIHNLFVPTEEEIEEHSSNWNYLLEQHFGGLYEVVDLIHDYAATFSSRSQSHILVPTVNVPLAGSTFTFGGWDVQIVPDGFTVIIDAVKLIISILATALFVNGLRNRFEKLIGGDNTA